VDPRVLAVRPVVKEGRRLEVAEQAPRLQLRTSFLTLGLTEGPSATASKPSPKAEPSVTQLSVSLLFSGLLMAPE
jgi:hypothetical protein